MRNAVDGILGSEVSQSGSLTDLSSCRATGEYLGVEMQNSGPTVAARVTEAVATALRGSGESPLAVTVLFGSEPPRVPDGWSDEEARAGEVVVTRWTHAEDIVAVERSSLSLAGVVHAGRCELEGVPSAVNRVAEAFNRVFGGRSTRFTPFVTRTAALTDDELLALLNEVGEATILLDQAVAQAQAYELSDVFGQIGVGLGRWRLAENHCDIQVEETRCCVATSTDGAPQVTLTIEDSLRWMRWLGSELEFADLFIQDALSIDGDFAVIEGIARALPHLQ